MAAGERRGFADRQKPTVTLAQGRLELLRAKLIRARDSIGRATVAKLHRQGVPKCDECTNRIRVASTRGRNSSNLEMHHGFSLPTHAWCRLVAAAGSTTRVVV